MAEWGSKKATAAKDCSVCGATFTRRRDEYPGAYARRETCSPTCSRKLARSRTGEQKKLVRERACAYCERPFMQARPEQFTCGNSCARAVAAGKVKSREHDGFVIAWRKTGRQYIHRAWPTEAEATRELADLLKPYPPGDPWRERLTVAPAKKERVAA